MCAGDRYRVHFRLKFDHLRFAIFSDDDAEYYLHLCFLQWTYSRLHPIRYGSSSWRQSDHLVWDLASSR